MASALPSSYTPPSVSGASATASSSKRRLLPAGPAYLNHLKLTLHHGSSFDSYDAHVDLERQKKEDELKANGYGQEDDLGVGEESESEELLSSDPKEWKVCNLIFSRFWTRLTTCIETRQLCCTRIISFEV